MRRPPVAVLLLLLAATTAAAQSPTADWSPVRQLSPGQEIRAIVEGGATHVGTLQAAADDSVTLLVHNDTQRIYRAAVREVSVGRKSRKRNVWWGLALGATASIVAVSLQCQGESSSCNEGSPAWFYPLAGAGALAGALMPPRTVWQKVYVGAP